MAAPQVQVAHSVTDTLRRAGGRLLIWSEAATAPDWVSRIDLDGTAELLGGPRDDDGRAEHVLKVAPDCPRCRRPSSDDLTYIAGVHPGVAQSAGRLLISLADHPSPPGAPQPANGPLTAASDLAHAVLDPHHLSSPL